MNIRSINSFYAVTHQIASHYTTNLEVSTGTLINFLKSRDPDIANEKDAVSYIWNTLYKERNHPKIVDEELCLSRIVHSEDLNDIRLSILKLKNKFNEQFGSSKATGVFNSILFYFKRLHMSYIAYRTLNFITKLQSEDKLKPYILLRNSFKAIQIKEFSIFPDHVFQSKNLPKVHSNDMIGLNPQDLHDLRLSQPDLPEQLKKPEGVYIGNKLFAVTPFGNIEQGTVAITKEAYQELMKPEENSGSLRAKKSFFLAPASLSIDTIRLQIKNLLPSEIVKNVKAIGKAILYNFNVLCTDNSYHSHLEDKVKPNYIEFNVKKMDCTNANKSRFGFLSNKTEINLELDANSSNWVAEFNIAPKTKPNALIKLSTQEITDELLKLKYFSFDPEKKYTIKIKGQEFTVFLSKCNNDFINFDQIKEMDKASKEHNHFACHAGIKVGKNTKFKITYKSSTLMSIDDNKSDKKPLPAKSKKPLPAKGKIAVKDDQHNPAEIPLSEFLINEGYVGLPPEEIEKVESVINQIIFKDELSEIIEARQLDREKGILFFGEPGTGKTKLALLIAKYLNCPEDRIQKIAGAELENKYYGGTQQNIRNLFAPARAAAAEKGKDAPLYIIIIDEIDALLPARVKMRGDDNHHQSAVTQFLAEMDGLIHKPNILVIGMTNLLDRLDKAAIRPGRLGKLVHVPMPNENQRTLIIERYLKPLYDAKAIDQDEIKMDELLQKTKDFSGADIKGFVDLASSTAFNRLQKLRREGVSKEELQVHPEGKITMLDLNDAISQIKVSKPPAKTTIAPSTSFNPSSSVLKNLVEQAKAAKKQEAKEKTDPPTVGDAPTQSKATIAAS